MRMKVLMLNDNDDCWSCFELNITWMIMTIDDNDDKWSVYLIYNEYKLFLIEFKC